MIFFFLKHIVKLCVAWRIIIIMVMQIYSTYGIALVSMTIAADKVHMSILCMPVYRCACVTYSQRLYVGHTCISECTIAAIIMVPTDQFQKQLP